MKRLLALSFLVLFISNCAPLTLEQAFERDFPNKNISSVPIDELLKSPEYLKINNINYSVGASINDIESNKTYVLVNIPDNYKLDTIWFIYSTSVRNSKFIDTKHISSYETSVFPNLEHVNGKYYEFSNINNYFINSIVIRIKKDSEIYYLKGKIDFLVTHPS